MSDRDVPSNTAASKAEAAFRAGRFATAAARFAIAAQGESDRRVAAHYIHERAIALRRAGDSAGAGDAAAEALGIAVPNSPDCEARMRLTLGNALADVGDYTGARAELVRAEELFVLAGQIIESQYAAIGSARCAFELGETDGPVATFLEFTRLGRSSELRSQALNNLALVRRRQGDLKAAVELFTEDLSLCQGKGDMPGAVISLINIGTTHQDRGDAVAAARALRQALRLVEDNRLELGIADAVRSALDELGSVDDG